MLLKALFLATLAFSKVAADNAMSKVVEKLEEMLESSKEQGANEKRVFQEFHCYCDTNDQEKTATIERLTEEIAEGEAKIKTLEADNERLDVDISKLNDAMANNEQERKNSESQRKSDHEAFEAAEDELKSAIEAVGDAKDKLDDKKSALQQLRKQATIKDKVKGLKPEQREKIMSLLQMIGPDDKVKKMDMGRVKEIFQKVKEAYEENLEKARDAEAESLDVHESFIADQKDLFKALKKQKEAKEGVQSDNSDAIASTSTEVDADTTEKGDTQESLELLRSSCHNRTVDYENRKHMRLNEQAALTKALSILDSDEAFNTFNSVKANKGGAASFLQVVRESNNDAQVRVKAEHMLRYIAKRLPTVWRLNLVAGLLQTGNPFDKVVAALDKMENDVKGEQRADEAQLQFCKNAHKTNDESLDNLANKISDYEDTIGQLRGTITEESTTIDEKTTALHELEAQMADATEIRNKENKDFTKSDSDMEKGIATMDKALKTLKAYYDKAAETPSSMLQKKKEEPETWKEGTYQSQDGGGVIDMLQTVRDDMSGEKKNGIDAEADSKASYDELMSGLESDAKTLREDIASVTAERAENKISLQDTIKVTNRTQEQVVAVERYIVKIKPQCDFIEENFDSRSEAHDTELEGLKEARKALMESDEYKKAVEEE